MAELPASPPRMSTTAAKPFDRLDPDRRAVIFGLLATLFLHLFLLLVAPHLLEFGMVRERPAGGEPEKAQPVFTVELPPEEQPAEKKPTTPFKFVEVNPDAPENVPDDTANFGAQNQQVAQEKPTPDGKSGYTVAVNGDLGNQRCEFWRFDLSSNKAMESAEFPCRRRFYFGMSGGGLGRGGARFYGRNGPTCPRGT